MPLVAFDLLERRYVLPGRDRRGWPKVAEVERRLDAFEWLVHVAREPQGIGSFVSDLAMAYLLSFESALQVLQADVFDDNPSAFDSWLKGQVAYDLLVRGLRTLRNLEAHIRPGVMTQHGEGGHSRFAGSDGGSTLGWRWSPIAEDDFKRLKVKKIVPSELSTFNKMLNERVAMELMRDGLKGLIRIHELADARATTEG